VIPGDVYAWAAVFILPVNSAINPFLYTLTAIIGQRVSVRIISNHMVSVIIISNHGSIIISDMENKSTIGVIKPRSADTGQISIC
jgi:predicted regulator of Ras-like GTPase activity (Roadblock/LC7/MglB family)